MSQSQRSDSQSPYEEPFPRQSATGPAVANGQPGQARPERPPACQSRQPPSAPSDMRSGSIATQDPCAATMFLMVGLPGAGKTTRAKELAAAYQALRLTPDHWMIPLFGDSMADGKRWVLEGRLISVALQALRLGPALRSTTGSGAAMNGRHCAGWPGRSVPHALSHSRQLADLVVRGDEWRAGPKRRSSPGP